MSRTSFISAILAVFCLSSSLANPTGNAAVNITNFIQNGGRLSNITSQLIDFSYDAVEWSNEVANFDEDWSSAENGEGSFLLSSSNGDQIILDALNFSNDELLNDALNQVVQGQTVASSIANAIAFGIENKTAAAPVAAPTVSTAAPVVSVAAPVAAPAANTSAPAIVVVPTVSVPEAEQVEDAGESEVVISEDSAEDNEAASGPVPIEVVVTREANPNGSVTTTTTKTYAPGTVIPGVVAAAASAPANNTPAALSVVQIPTVEAPAEAVEAVEAVEAAAVEAVEQAEAVEAVPIIAPLIPAVSVSAPEEVEVNNSEVVDLGEGELTL